MIAPTEQFWDDLLLFIEEGKVVPVVGAELVTVGSGAAETQLRHRLAARLAAAIGLPAGDLPAAPELDDVVAGHVRRGGERSDLYARLLHLLREEPPQPAPPLLELAAMLPLQLFVSLTFDGQLAAALTAVRPGQGVTSIAYAPNAVRDLPVPYESLREPTVFHLLGRAASTPEYAICDDDLLEFLHALQDGPRRPARLFDALRSNHILLLGCGFGDWLARFFLRTARGLELSQRRKRWDILADSRSGQDPALTVFLSSFSSDTRQVDLAPAAFVHELARRWRAAHPQVEGEPLGGAGTAANGATPHEGAVFVSYASDDLDAASRLVEALRAARLDVWFDKGDLRPADDWERAIQRGIERCSLFLPVVSRQTLAAENRRRFFWREWNAADQIAGGLAPEEQFIIPIVIDDSRLDDTGLPRSFQRKQGVAAPQGMMPPGLPSHLQAIVRDFHRRRRGGP